VGIFETDIDGMCTYTNPRWQALTGLDAQASVGRGWIDAVHPDDRHAVLDAWIWATRLGREYTGRFRVVNRQGEVRWVRLHSTVNHDGERVTGRVGTLEDITEQRMAAEALQQANDALEKRVAERTERLSMVVSDLEQEVAERKWAEEALRQSEERFARAFHASPSAVIITSRVDGRTVDVNESFLRLTGFNREEVLGSTMAQMAIWKYPEERARLIDLMGTKGSITDYEMTIRSRTGKEHTVVVSAERMPLGDEECILAIGTDITERKALEQHLLEYAEAQRTLLSQRIAAQEAERRRLSMDVHDGPLQSLGVSLMALDRAIRRLDSGELEVAHRELRYLRTSLSGTVSELRSVLADLSVENLTTHGLVFALHSNVERFSEVTGIRVVVDDNIEGRLPGDIELLLYRLVQEALANVRKHSEAQRVLVRIEQVDGNVVLTVRDDGRGFNPEEVLARHRDGEHLGLASMRERVQAIGGSLSIVSAPEQGTTLTFRCPLPGPDLIPGEMHSGQDLTA
jgi:PAS domain S-box-containing protein